MKIPYQLISHRFSFRLIVLVLFWGACTSGLAAQAPNTTLSGSHFLGTC